MYAWAGLTDADGRGVLFVAPGRMSFSVSPYTESELFFTDHDYRLPEPDKTVVHLDLGVTGLGGASCGQGGPLEEQRISASPPIPPPAPSCHPFIKSADLFV